MDLRVAICADARSLQHQTEATRSADLVVFPELVDGGYAALKEGTGEHRMNDPFVDLFRKSSRAGHQTVVAGSMSLRDGAGRPTNSSLVFRTGRLVHRYDKVHLFGPAGDTRYFATGASCGTFPLGKSAGRLRAGVVICFDLRFPELIRMMARGGDMGLLIVPARWPAKRDDAWRSLLKARAIENQMFVVGCNAHGREGGFSYVFDPMGKVVFSSRVDPGALEHTLRLDLRLLKRARALHNNLAEARVLKAIALKDCLGELRAGRKPNARKQ